MRVVFLRSNPVEPDSRVEKEVNSLIKIGYDVEILAWDRSYKYKIKETYLSMDSGKVLIHRFGMPAAFGGGIKKNLIPLIIFQIKLFKWLYKNRNMYDIIHACDFDTSYTAMKVAKKFNKKLVYDIFDYYIDAFNVPDFMKSFIEKKDLEVIKAADLTIICTEKRKEQIKRSRPKRLVIIHNTPELSKDIIKTTNTENSKIKIAYVGILADGRFIKEIAEIVKSNPCYELHIGGFGKLESYFENMSKEYSNIVFYGKLPYKKTLELENNCDIMTAIYDPSVPNNYYAAPNKFYEALMLGKPIIMAKNTGMDEIVSKNDIGEVIDYSIESLQTALFKLVLRRSEWPDMANRMKYIYEKYYKWSEMEKRLYRMYKEIL
ncbi:MAG: glycosyltransferase [Sedimentibacter sp.]|jgi:glycosyltransferase involved in cell wall biosynthesis|nr:glycosyltransferase [Sedimentibacter sp.]